jgi:hypothetical protein
VTIARARHGSGRWLLFGGVLLGVATIVKIWAVTAVLIVAVFLA